MTSSLQRTAETNRPPSVAETIVALRPKIAQALPKHMDADRMARLALTVLRKDPALARCNPESFVGSLLTAAALGLEPGVNGEAYLVAYKGECTLIVGYQGFAKLFWQHPMAKHLDAQAVHENDEFDYAYGLEPMLVHKPAKGDRGDVTHYYAVASLSSGARVFTVLTAAETKALRNGKVGSNGGIKDPMRWMERKTALRQLVKMLPKSPNLARALEADDRTGRELYRERVAELAPPAAVEVVETVDAGPVNSDTGEIVDAVPVEDPDEPNWPEPAQPPA